MGNRLERILDQELRAALELHEQLLDKAQAELLDRVKAAAIAATMRWVMDELSDTSRQAPVAEPRQMLMPCMTCGKTAARVGEPNCPVCAGVTFYRCQACRTLQPLKAVRAYNPDGAPDAVDYVCRDWQACSQRARRETAL